MFAKTTMRLQLPCGTGKTYIALHLIQKSLEADPHTKHVYFAPWVDLAVQTATLLRGDKKTCFHSFSLLYFFWMPLALHRYPPPPTLPSPSYPHRTCARLRLHLNHASNETLNI